jgi:hypothetical protein
MNGNAPDDTWWEGPLCVTHPVNGRRIVGIYHDDRWRWIVHINGPPWNGTHLDIMFPAGSTVEEARKLATALGPVRTEDESERAQELLNRLEELPKST